MGQRFSYFVRRFSSRSAEDRVPESPSASAFIGVPVSVNAVLVHDLFEPNAKSETTNLTEFEVMYRAYMYGAMVEASTRQLRYLRTCITEDHISIVPNGHFHYKLRLKLACSRADVLPMTRDLFPTFRVDETEVGFIISWSDEPVEVATV